MGVTETSLHGAAGPYGIRGSSFTTAKIVPTVLQPERTVQGWKLL